MIRKATRNDIPRVSEIRFAVRENRLSPRKLELVRTSCDWLIDHSDFWVWDEGGTIQGFSSGDPRDGSIFALFVDPAREGSGIGRQLLRCACETLRTAGHRTATLTTAAGTRAERLYRADGWKETGRLEDGQIVFEKQL